MPWPQTAIVYPGTCLVEGTNLSEGRGTALPFHLLGAPWIDGSLLAEELNLLDLPGVRFHGVTFQPTADKWAGQPCGGVQLHVTDRMTFRPVDAGLHILATIRSLYHERLEFRASGGDENAPYIDLLIGTDRVRRGLVDGTPMSDLVSLWQSDLDTFFATAQRFHLYV
jgi:beta-N-acetylhexosaminidase